MSQNRGNQTIVSMKVIKLSILLLLVSTFSSIVGEELTEANPPTKDWRYESIILNEGTRSEVTIGKLSYKKEEVIGKDRHYIKTDIGYYICYDLGIRNIKSWIRVEKPNSDVEKIPVIIDLRSEKLRFWNTIEKVELDTVSPSK